MADTLVQIKARMPINEAGGTTVTDMHVFIDTVDELTTQQVKTVSTTTYTALQTDNRWKVLFTNASAVTVTIPNSITAGWECSYVQMGAGQVTVTVTGGALLSRAGHTKTAGQYAMAYLFVSSNAGTAPQVLLGGDTA